MDWQQIASLVIVAFSAILLGHREVQRRKRARLGVCAHDCGCSPIIESNIQNKKLEELKTQRR